MITVLLSTPHKALKAVYSPASKLPKQLKVLPILSHVLIESTDEGRLKVTSPVWNPEKESLESVSETIPARIETEFKVCVPARQINDWVRVSQLTKEEKSKGQNEQITLTIGEGKLIIRAGLARCQFNTLDAGEFPALSEAI